ncbi:DUF6931 family protein [Tundrisphaera sp. TA3]|uniref:DUF6931 family protein n=1 Tax=Tundrisphaera sp. TA3 TaxID=3435775 RepID=UPI003EBB93EA
MSQVRAATTPSTRTAAAIGLEAKLGRRARSLLTDELRPGQYLSLLIRGRHHADAIRFMAHSLLNREAVWWGCLCARHALGESPAPAHRDALGAAVRWVIAPTDDHRREAGEAGVKAGRGAAAGCIARAAQYAAGPPAPADSPTPTPALILPSLAARLCGAGILRAAGAGAPGGLSVRYRQFIALGLDVAYGANRWE